MCYYMKVGEQVEDKQLKIREQDRQRLRGFRLLDDDFMKMVFDNNIEATELLLNVFFDRYDMKVLSVVSQREIKNPNGRSIRLDIYAVDSEGHHYDIEVQRQDRGAGERRARFNSSLLDTKLLKVGQNPDEIPDSYVIFITENDVRKQNRPIYRFHRRDDETNEIFDDGSHIIYVNGAYQNEENRIGQLMHDFRAVSADQMHNKVLADRVRYFKEDVKGVEAMCKVMEDMRNEAVHDDRIRIAEGMLKMGTIEYEDIAKLTNLTVEEVKEIASRQSA